MLLSSAYADEPVDCSGCHEQQVKDVAAASHQKVGCTDCHSNVREYPHPANVQKKECGQCHTQIAESNRIGVHGRAKAAGNEMAPDCATCHGPAHKVEQTGTQAFRQSIPGLCGGCHAEPGEEFAQSIHGTAVQRGIVEAPVCSTCHGEHAILPKESAASPVSAQRIPETCGQCHGDARLNERFQLPRDVLVSFQSSFHGLALRGGEQTVANCSSCHAAHLILPSSDPRSRIAPANLANTCGQCHAGAGRRFIISNVHWTAEEGEPRLARFVRVTYRILIPVVLGLMLLHVLGDWLRKLWDRRVQLRGEPDYNPGPRLAWQRHPSTLRMYPEERIQHALLLIFFLTLVWSGFALTYPDQWWARPLLVREGLRGLVHRIAASGLMAVAVVHLITLFWSRRLRHHWKTLTPAASDIREAIQGFAYALGLRRERPVISSHSYVEKTEYWAVIWGTAIMAATGLLLWFATFFLRWLPKIAFDVATTIHFYEAVLASLAIAVWHFYFVIFDPDVYPMDPAWITGHSVRPRQWDEEAEHVAEESQEKADDKESGENEKPGTDQEQ